MSPEAYDADEDCSVVQNIFLKLSAVILRLGSISDLIESRNYVCFRVRTPV